MTKRDITRHRILHAGLRMASQSGFNGVSLGPLADAVDLSKSGLFAHFDSKEALQLALLDYAAEHFREMVVRPALAKKRGLPRLRAAFDLGLDWADRAKLPGGCVFYAAAAELDDQEGPVRQHLVEFQSQWLDTLERLTRGAIETGELRRGLDVKQFVSDFFGIFMMHRFASRLMRDPSADKRARTAFARLIANARPTPQ